MTRIFDLPRDLVKEIISRVSLKSVRAVRLTCKSWNKLSKSRRFSKMHLAKTIAREEESRMIVMMDYNLNNLYLMRIVDVNEKVSRESIGKLTCLNDSEQVKVSQAFYSEGLLLCILKDDNIVVWIPYSGQTKWIKKPKYPLREDCWYRYALGYVNKKNKSHRSHKILNISVYEIYDFDSDLWTSIDVNPHWKRLSLGVNVSLKGNTYWPATKSSPDDDEEDDHIICFDFTRERFGPRMRMPFDARQNDYVTLSCVREEKHAAILTHNKINPFGIDVWITTIVEPEKVSWSKFLTLNTKLHYPITPMCSFIDEEKKLVIGFDDTTANIVGENRYLKQLDLRERGYKNYFSQCVCSYVPSLVQIKKGKRKKQSHLEKPVKEQSPRGGKKRKRVSVYKSDFA